MHRFLLAAILVVPALPAAAQQQDEMISKRLIALLFPGFLDRIVEGLPDDFPEDVLPDGAMPLVSMSTSNNVTVVTEARSFTLADRPRYERKLAAAGWKEGAGPMGGRGLTASPVPVPTMFCRDDRLLSYTTQPRAGGGHHVRITLSRVGQYGPCSNDPRESGPSRSMFDDVDVPPLPAPADSRSMGMSSGGSGDAFTQTVRLETRMTPSDVEAYYTALLTEAGWKREARLTGEGVSIARFAPPSERDGPRVGTLDALALPGGDVLVTLRVVGPRRDLLP